ncbi:hypothetical protein [Nocardia wallacei]|uniref:hypothetical protein n=1 Tax=Nocardia wallacei TaxID=480035 RepID=UPI002454D4E7|nr:hypothetical protein [Nocardia wallacei]
MSWNTRIRQWHRGLALTFVATLVVTVVGLALQGPVWLSYVPLPPLILLLLSGLVLLVRYASGRRAGGIRTTHRWSAAVFTATVLATIVALALPEPIVAVSYLPLAPLAVLLITGLTMLVRQHTGNRVTDQVAAVGNSRSRRTTWRDHGA